MMTLDIEYALCLAARCQLIEAVHKTTIVLAKTSYNKPDLRKDIQNSIYTYKKNIEVLNNYLGIKELCNE